MVWPTKTNRVIKGNSTVKKETRQGWLIDDDDDDDDDDEFFCGMVDRWKAFGIIQTLRNACGRGRGRVANFVTNRYRN